MSKYHRTFIFVAVSAGLASSLSLLGGIGLELVADKILPLLPLIIAIPALNDTVGNYASIIAAHTGDPSERNVSRKKLAISIFKVLSINIIAIVLLSLALALTRDYLLTIDFIIKFASFIALAISITIVFMFGLAHVLDVILRKEKINPDELLIPIVTSMADIFMLFMIVLAVLTIF
jgi:cation transporter-like permease